MSIPIQAAERSLLPDVGIRWGIRRLVEKRRRSIEERFRSPDAWSSFLQSLRDSRIAIETAAANDQHYEVPAAFYRLCLGQHLKYSASFWDASNGSLDLAEANSLALTCERAQLENGQDILELGCGWGSLSLFMAERYPESRILSISNSASQRRHIQEEARARALDNLRVATVDVNQFAPKGRFDRIVSVEMFEHMRNWEQLLRRLSESLQPAGRIFLHYFSHRQHAYCFEDDGKGDWMARHFFTGGLMPSHDLPRRIQIPLEVEEDWQESGTHYQRTAEAWLERLDGNLSAARAVFLPLEGGDARAAARVVQRWRIFFMACAELFGSHGGSEWLVSHCRLRADPRAT